MANNISDIAAKATIDVGPASRSLGTLEQQTRNSTSRIARDTAAASAGAQRSLQQSMAGFGLARLAPIGMAAASISALNQGLRQAMATRADAMVQEAMRGDTSMGGRLNMLNQGFLDTLPLAGGIRDFFTIEARQGLEQSNTAVERQARSLAPLRETARAIDAATNALHDQAQTFEMTTEQAQRYALVMRGIRAGVPRETIEGMLQQFDAAASEAAKARAFRESLTQAQEQKRQQEAARIAQETQRAQRDAGTSPELGSLDMGSREAQAIINAAMAPRQMERVAVALEDLLDVQKGQALTAAEDAAEHLEAIKEVLTQQNPFDTV